MTRRKRDEEMIDLYNKGYRAWWFVIVTIIFALVALLIGLVIGIRIAHKDNDRQYRSGYLDGRSSVATTTTIPVEFPPKVPG